MQENDKNIHPLKQARLKIGYTQAMLADFAQVGRATIQRAEKGEPLRPDSIHMICKHFSEYYQRRVEPEELGLASWQAEQSYNDEPDPSYSQEEDLEGDTEGDDPMDRREAIKTIGGIGVVLATPPHLLSQTLSHQTPLAPVQLPHVEEEMWPQFEKLIETCWHLSKGNTLDIVEPILWSYLPPLATIADRPGQQQQIAASIASKGYQLAAILAGHRDDLNARQSYCEHALSYGNKAKDRNLQIAALRQLALTFDYKDRPRKALETYESSLPLLNEASPLLRARMYAGLAYSYALYDQEQEALRCIKLAYESFPDDPDNDPTSLYADCGYFTIVLWDGLTRMDLNRFREADQAFAQIDGREPKIKVPERVRIEFLNYQAEAFIGLRDLERCCAYLEEAVQASLKLRSERRYTQASEVYQKMRQVWHNEPRVKALRDLFTA